MPDGTEMAATSKTLELSGLSIAEGREGRLASEYSSTMTTSG